MRHRFLRCAALVLLVSSAGCFNYYPSSVAELTPGQTVRAYVSREQASELNALIGLQGRELVGKVVTRNGDGLLLEVPAVAAHQGPAGRMLNQRVAVPASALLEIEERRLNGWKTALVAGGITAAIGALVAVQLGDEENSPVRNPKPTPEAVRFPWIRIGVP